MNVLLWGIVENLPVCSRLTSLLHLFWKGKSLIKAQRDMQVFGPSCVLSVLHVYPICFPSSSKFSEQTIITSGMKRNLPEKDRHAIVQHDGGGHVMCDGPGMFYCSRTWKSREFCRLPTNSWRIMSGRLFVTFSWRALEFCSRAVMRGKGTTGCQIWTDLWPHGVIHDPVLNDQKLFFYCFITGNVILFYDCFMARRNVYEVDVEVINQ